MSTFTGLVAGTLATALHRVTGELDPVPTTAEVKPGLAYFALFLLLAAATVLLWFSMRKQMRRITVPRDDADLTADPTVDPTDGPGPGPAGGTRPAGGTGDTGSTAAR